MARVSFVTTQIYGALDVGRQIRIDLNQAEVIALIPVVAAPRLVIDELDFEVLAFRQGKTRQRPCATLGNRQVKDTLQTIFGDYEPGLKRCYAFGKRGVTRQQCIYFVENVLNRLVGIRPTKSEGKILLLR